MSIRSVGGLGHSAVGIDPINTGGAVIPAILNHWSFDRFSNLGSEGATFAAAAYFLAALAVVLATRGQLSLHARPSKMPATQMNEAS